MHGTRRLLAIAFVALAFAAGFGLATLLARGPTTAARPGSGRPLPPGPAGPAAQLLPAGRRLSPRSGRHRRPARLPARSLHRVLHRPAGQRFSPGVERHLHRDRHGRRQQGRSSDGDRGLSGLAGRAGQHPPGGDHRHHRGRTDGRQAGERKRGPHSRSGGHAGPPAAAAQRRRRTHRPDADATQDLPAPHELAPHRRPRHEGRLRVPERVRPGRRRAGRPGRRRSSEGRRPAARLRSAQRRRRAGRRGCEGGGRLPARRQGGGDHARAALSPRRCSEPAAPSRPVCRSSCS